MCLALLFIILAGCMGMLMLVGWALFSLINDAERQTAARACALNEAALPPLAAVPPHFSPKERGEELLLRLLSPSQRYEYQRHGTITVPITLPGSIYAFARIGKGTRGVIWIPQPSSTRGNTDQCVYVDPTPDKLVKEDDLISKLLWLRADPDALAKVSGMQLHRFMRPFPDWFHPPQPPHAI